MELNFLINKNMKMKKVLISVLIGVFAFTLSSIGVSARQDNASSKKNSSAKEEKVKELKNFEKASAGQSNAKVYKEKVEKVTGNLKKIANEQSLVEEASLTSVVSAEEPSSVEISEEVATVAVDVESTIEETSDAIEKVESRNKFTKLLVGTDYKNLGQLRSSMVKNRNQIRQLTRLFESTEGETQAQIETQLTELMQEQERISTVIKENESGFSILGWVFKFFNGYSRDAEVDEAEETQLENEVADVLVDDTDEITPIDDITNDATSAGTSDAVEAENDIVTEAGANEGDTTMTGETFPAETPAEEPAVTEATL